MKYLNFGFDQSFKLLTKGENTSTALVLSDSPSTFQDKCLKPCVKTTYKIDIVAESGGSKKGHWISINFDPEVIFLVCFLIYLYKFIVKVYIYLTYILSKTVKLKSFSKFI
jgi:hypothetical protein